MDSKCNIFEPTEEEKDIAAYTKLKYTMPFKKFVQAKEANDQETIGSIEDKKTRPGLYSGTKAKNSYLRIVGNDALKSCNTANKNNLVTKGTFYQSNKKKFTTVNKLSINEVMKAAETNDVAKVLEFIKVDKEFVLNSRDQYGWNALMNACCAGAKSIVQLLLKYQLNLDIADKKGNTCFSLAQSKGYSDIVKLLNYKRSKSDCIFETERNERDKTETESFYCDVCKEIVVKSTKSHFTSTVHLFNSFKKSGVPTSYGIPENNVGFQMLLKTGWDREKGLGPEGSGQKFPPKTALKEDRTGLGAKKYVSRVTHDSHLLVNNRVAKQRSLNRRERLRNHMKSQRKIRELRRMLD